MDGALEQGCDVAETVLPVLHHHPAADDDRVDVRRAGDERQLGGVRTGGPYGVRAQGDQVRTRPDLDPPGVGPAERAVPGLGGHREQGSRVERPAPSGPQQSLEANGRVVRPDGTLFYPYIGAVKAAGLTVEELRASIAKRLTKVIAGFLLTVLLN